VLRPKLPCADSPTGIVGEIAVGEILLDLPSHPTSVNVLNPGRASAPLRVGSPLKMRRPDDDPQGFVCTEDRLS
jgi:hypothetical protein